jgi:hypothetical protein
MRETGFSSQIRAKVYIHTFPVIFHDNLQRESHEYYEYPISVALLQPLRGQTKTNSSIASDNSLDSLKLPVPEAGDFVESILL